MRLTPTLRLVATALVVFLATALLWWLVGYQIGKGLLEGAVGGAGFRAGYGHHDGGIARLIFLSLLSVIALAASGESQGAGRWALLAGLGLGSALVLGARGGTLAALVLFVLAAVATDEAEPFSTQLVTALALALVVAFAQELDSSIDDWHAAIAILLRGALFWWPLLAGPHLVGRYLLAPARRGG
jgi:hypothetical protein